MRTRTLDRNRALGRRGSATLSVSARALLTADITALGAIAHWSLDSAAWADAIGGKSMLAATGASADAGGLSGQLAMTGSGHLYRGVTNDFAEITGTQPKAFEFTVTPNLPRTGANVRHTVFAKRDDTGTAPGFTVYLQWNQATSTVYPVVLLQNPTSGYRVEAQAADLPNGTPAHIMLSHTGVLDASVRWTLWINGKQQTLTVAAAWGAPADPSIANAHPFAIGARRDSAGNASEFLTGSIDELAIYTSTLAQDDAIHHASLVRGRVPPAATIPATAKNLIVSTDMLDDCDDVTAMLTAIALHKVGETTLRAVVADSCGFYSAAVADTLLKMNAVAGVPVGAHKGAIGPGSGHVEATVTSMRSVALRFSANNLGQKANYPDDVAVMRQALVDLPAGQKAVIASVGTLNSVSALLSSAADGISPLTGAALVAAKVERLVVMGGTFSGATVGGSGSYNLAQSPAAANNVFTNWPSSVPLIVHGEDVGGAVFTQPDAAAVAAPLTSPAGYVWQLMSGLLTSGRRPSWDALAVIAAVRGDAGWFRSLGLDGTITVNASTGANEWFATPHAGRHFQRRPVAAATAATALEALMAGLI
jgi:inosine-uridine nucleoside N-ribohydrolase